MKYSVTSLDECRIEWAKIHSVGHELEDELVAHRLAVLADQVAPRLPERHAPDFTHVVPLVRKRIFTGALQGDSEWTVRRPGSAVVALRWVNVIERERILGHVVRVRVTADSMTIVKAKPNAFREFSRLDRICPTPCGKRGHEKNSLLRRRPAVAPVPAGFQAAFAECFGAVLPALPKRRGRRPRVPLAKVLPALVFHVMNAAGTLAEHFAQLFDEALADSSLSERRTRLPWEVFAELMRLGLRGLARTAAHPEAFWRGWRLVALDGSQFSLTNTPQIQTATRKAKSRRGRAAFGKLTTGVLLELGLHNPLAAAIGRGGQSE